VIETYGNKFSKYKHYTGVQRRFNALVINSQKPKHVDLRYARGTHREVQKCVASGKRFEEVMTNIVQTTERDNLQSIGIYCRAGHHRSVACGELLHKHVYLKATVHHLTISK
jgi:RNase adaptor protein for sRNA GlmZ degradation